MSTRLVAVRDAGRGGGEELLDLGEHADYATQDALQHLPARVCWDEDGVRDDLRGYAVEHLADPSDRVGSVPVADDTGDLRKGGAIVGAQRQYTGAAVPIKNAQIEVDLAFAGSRGPPSSTTLYLAKVWTGDAQR